MICTFRAPRYLILMIVNNYTIRKLRESIGLTQVELAKRAGLSLRSIKNAEGQKKQISPTTARKLAVALGVEITLLVAQRSSRSVAETRPSSVIQQLSPPVEFDEALLTKWIGALEADMREDYASAGRALKELKARSASSGNSRTEIILRLAVVLDNEGKSKDALTELESLEKSDQLRRLPSHIYDWIRYHSALAYRRLAERSIPLNVRFLNQAQAGFRKVHDSTRDVQQRTACKHQLGVIAWIKSKQAIKKSVANSESDLARKYFLEAARQWKKCKNFREGYSLRRLAALEFSQGKSEKAFNHWLDSIEIFARHGCHRYLKEVRRDLSNAFLK